MKWLLNIIGILVALAGAVFFLQGINVIPVGGMAGQSQWVIIGGIMVVVGVGLLYFSNRRNANPQAPK